MNEYGQIVEQKKSVWDILDVVLKPAVDIYTGIRGNAPTDPRDNAPTDPRAGLTGLPTSQLGTKCDEGFVMKNGKCVKKSDNTLLILGGVLLVGTAAFFVVKKMRSNS